MQATAIALGLVPIFAASCHCGQQEAEPQKVSEQAPVIESKTLPPRSGPFSDPNVDPPGDRGDVQLAADQLAATLAKAKGLAEQGKPLPAIIVLDRCANKKPQSIECEGELAMLLIAHKRRKAHATYYLEAAASATPPIDDTNFYRRVGRAGLVVAKFKAAEQAFGIVVAREEATAQDYGDFAAAVQGAKGSTEVAIDAYLKGYALDNEKAVWLRNASALVARTGDNARALKLLKQYAEAASLTGKPKKVVDRRIAELEHELAPK